ncbi:transmembrane protein [Tieghemostelium lacteum]|uniref:Transmembrane protein n=1 Tax=Tieghemostelium lacteum TaxID=361077 RepID=A0A151ZB31_TIELA|nr:transmembrane protein [Tieghemostelium lacteum]|eukprot:KYQ91157.1 transmembrane protein [Tieghemostelium lacteum]
MLKFFVLFLFFYISIGLVLSCDGPDSDSSLSLWSSASTWGSAGIPVAGGVAIITGSMKVLLDISTPRLQQINILPGGQLVVSSKHGPISIYTGGILIEGRLDIGNDGCRYNGSVTINLTGKDGVSYYETRNDMGRKFIGVLPGGRLELHGIYSYPIPSWTQLTKTAKTGDTILNLNADVSQWPINGTVVVGTTDYDMLQSEEVTIVACPECTSKQIKIASPGVKYYHYGQFTYGVDQRAEVGLLTKSIKIQGEMESTCTKGDLCRFFNFDTLGGHMRFLKGFGSVHIQGVELTKMGQTYNLGCYPIHFHMCGDLDIPTYADWPTFIKDNSIHHTLSRCLTIHGTSGLIAVNNFAYDHYGHCYFLEDASEERNYLESNVGMVTRYGYLLPSDRSCELCLYLKPYDFNGNPTSCSECEAVATFWITNPNNVLKNNIAGGSIKAGIWYAFPDHPSGLSDPLYPKTFPPYIKVAMFVGNKVHSNTETGMMIDSGFQVVQPSASTPSQYLSMNVARYKPRVNSTDPTSARAVSEFLDFTAYKNKWRGLWARGGDLLFHNSFFSDNAIGATLASEGVMPADPGSTQRFIGCTFVAESENLGMATNGVNTYKGHTIPAWQEFTQRGVELYDGPCSISYSTFINYNTDGVRSMSAIGWLLYNDWQFGSKNKFIGNSYINSNLKVLNVPSIYDGTKNQIFLDDDGSTTGTINASVVPNVDYFASPACIKNTAWNMSTCSEKYGMLFIYNLDLSSSYIPNGQSGVIMIRDQYPTYKHTLMGVPNSSPRNTFMPLVMIGRTYTMHFAHATPPSLNIQMANFDKSDSVVVGICYPTWGVSFAINRNVVVGWKTSSNKITLGSSLSAVENDASGLTGFYDSSSGLLFVKFIQNGTRTWNMYCPDSGCESINIKITGSGVNSNSGDCSSAAYPKYTKKENVVYGGCNGNPNLVIDACGICGGNGLSCKIAGTLSNVANTVQKPLFFNFICISLLIIFTFLIFI